MQLIFFFAMLHAVYCALAMLIGLFWFMMAAGESLQRKIYDPNEQFKMHKNSAKITIQLCDFIGFHSEIKELSAV